MHKLEILKKGVAFTAGLGIGQIISGVVASTTPTDTTYQKVTVYTGRIAIGLVVGEVIDNYFDRQFENAAVWWKENITTKVES